MGEICAISSDLMLRTIFDSGYRQYFKPATQDVPLLFVLYALCTPLAKLLVRAGASPAAVTHLSNILAMCSLAALVWSDNPWWFSLFWVGALCFDVADGIVARVTKQSSAAGSFYDHVSDQIKMIGLFFAVGVRYDDPIVWGLAYGINSAFLLSAVINQVIAHRRFRLASQVGAALPSEIEVKAPVEASPGFANSLRAALRQRPLLRQLVRGIYLSVFSVYGNAMLFLVALSFGRQAAIVTMTFFCVVMARALFMLFRTMYQVNAELARSNVAWK